MNIETMTNAGLVAAFNAIPGVKPTRRFPNRASGIRRLKEAIEEASRSPKLENGPSEPVNTPPRQREKAAPAPVVNVAQKGEQKAPRPGSKRAQIVALLEKGAGIDEYLDLWGGRITCPKRIAGEVRYAASELGVGVKTVDGRWRLAHRQQGQG